MASTTDIETTAKKETRIQKALTFCLHFFGLCIIFSLPEMFLSLDKSHQPPGIIVYMKPVLLVSVFYINYYLIFRFYGQRKWVLKMTISNFMLICLLLTAMTTAVHAFDRHPERTISHTLPAGMHNPYEPVARDFMLSLLTATLSITIRLAGRTIDLERRQDQQLAQQRTEELRRLKAQLRPHFLFNALNSVYALIDINPEMAKQAVHRMCQLLRYVLYDTTAYVTVRQDFEFIDNYVKIMAIRLSGSTRLNLSLNPGSYGDTYIPPLLFVNLIENTFKHGRTNSSDDYIDISLSVDDEKRILTCRTVNKVGAAPATPSGGVGLSNLRRRLELLYGDEATLSTTTRNGEFLAILTLPLDKNQLN